MYLVEDRLGGAKYLIFTWDDPRADGYEGPVQNDVTLDYDLESERWRDGDEAPESCVGQQKDNPAHYKVFRRPDAAPSEFQLVPANFAVVGSWADYARLRLSPPTPNQVDDQQWYEYLDRIDEEARRRRSRDSGAPAGRDRDSVAAWVARKHLIADVGVREIWYLPTGAPEDEIRLLELNDQMPGDESILEAQDFGVVDIDGASFHLYVADVTTNQLEQAQKDPSQLPSGWSLDGRQFWRRGA